ncbi:MAG: hypothetical protein AAFU78_21650 [Cyanobacteria bacterium J06633_2]
MSSTYEKIIAMGGDKWAYHRLRLSAIKRKEYGIPPIYDELNSVKKNNEWNVLKRVSNREIPFNEGSLAHKVFNTLIERKIPMTSSQLMDSIEGCNRGSVRRTLVDLFNRGVIAKRRIDNRAYEYKVNPDFVKEAL